MFGFLVFKKGLHLLVDAVRKVQNVVNNVVLLIIRASRKEMTLHRKFGISVVLTGYVPENEQPLYFSAADVFVFPSDDDVVGALGAVARVLCYSKPIIVTDVPRFYELKRDGVVMVVPSGNAESLAKVVMNTLNNLNGVKAGKMLQYCRERSWKVIASRWLEIIKQLA
ncbi:MAG: glycosyltransferase [Aigarchaeota archaeon]|nr:glycosyltransferase [Candidatus Pelearchaeum maunauluense]